MTQFQIKARIDTSIIFKAEVRNLKACVELAVKKKISLREADLREADLREADLCGANLRRAYLYGADLRRANLYGADLSGANLREADLREADLREADLRGAYFGGTYLGEADLGGAKTDDLMCITDLQDAINLAPMIFDFWKENNLETTQEKFGMYKISSEDRALVLMCPQFVGGYCFVLKRREIWWWNWFCPNPDTVPVLWREGK